MEPSVKQWKFPLPNRNTSSDFNKPLGCDISRLGVDVYAATWSWALKDTIKSSCSIDFLYFLSRLLYTWAKKKKKEVDFYITCVEYVKRLDRGAMTSIIHPRDVLWVWVWQSAAPRLGIKLPTNNVSQTLHKWECVWIQSLM